MPGLMTLKAASGTATVSLSPNFRQSRAPYIERPLYPNASTDAEGRQRHRDQIVGEGPAEVLEDDAPRV